MKIRTEHLIFFAALLWCAAIASACQPLPSPGGAPTAAPATPTLPADPGQLAVRQAWESGKHASTYVIEEDKNNDCARCHSPLSWIPTSPEDMPATCASCKFTIKTPKPVAKADWRNIGCEQCHKVEKEVLTKQVAWLNTAIGQFDTTADPYEPVQSNTELCAKCHRGGYEIALGTRAHAGKGCTDCHNAHSTKANCANCHPALKEAAGHDKAHAAVNCVACHDASGLKVGPTQDKKTWLTFRPADPRGKPGDSPYVSHDLQRKVDCARCHFPNNPWGLKGVSN